MGDCHKDQRHDSGNEHIWCGSSHDHQKIENVRIVCGDGKWESRPARKKIAPEKRCKGSVAIYAACSMC